MVKIRLTRLGRHKKPFFRLVAIDSRSSRDSSYIELLGTLEPKTGTTTLNKEAILKWLNLGAQPTDTAKDLLSKNGIWKEFKLAKDQAASEKAQKAKATKPTKKAKKETKPTAKKKKLSAAKPISNVELKAKIAIKKTAAKKAKAAKASSKKALQKKLVARKLSSSSKTTTTKKVTKTTKAK